MFICIQYSVYICWTPLRNGAFRREKGVRATCTTKPANANVKCMRNHFCGCQWQKYFMYLGISICCRIAHSALEYVVVVILVVYEQRSFEYSRTRALKT